LLEKRGKERKRKERSLPHSEETLKWSFEEIKE